MSSRGAGSLRHADVHQRIPLNANRILAARWIIPVSSPPINGGWVRLAGDRVVEFGKGQAPAPADDLGDVVLLPGLVNAHTHLEFSDLRQPVGVPGMPLHEWIGLAIGARGVATAETRRAAIASGLAESRAAGVRLIGEITTPPSVYPDQVAGPEWVSFAEVVGLQAQRGAERLRAASEYCAADLRGGWSPHAPYSTAWHLIEACVAQARRHSRPLAMHVAESPHERELLETAAGPFAETLRALGVWQEGLFPWPARPLERLIELLAAAPRVLLVHGNYLSESEIERLAAHRNTTVVYCPRTHSFFRHPPHPVARLGQAGIRVALGTDSRASNPDLDLWQEVRHLLRYRPDIDPHEVIKMATLHGADALGRRDVGRIETGARPGFRAVPTAASDLAGLWASLAE